MSKLAENIIVIVAMVAIVAGLLFFVGYDNIETWLCEPFVWKEPDFLSMEYVGAEEDPHGPYLYFEVYNRSDYDIEEYTFQVVADAGSVKIRSYEVTVIGPDGYKSYKEDLVANGFTTLRVSCSPYGMNKYAYDVFKNLSSSEIRDLEYRAVELRSGSETLLSNNGWFKTITILVVSAVLGLLGFVKKFPVWLRILLKICGWPVVLCLTLLLLFAWGRSQSDAAVNTGSSGGQSSANNSQFNDAQQRYNRAANQRAGAVKTGNAHSAAKAQEEMDRAMADMLVAQGADSSAAARYKREANLKAGANLTGRTGDAARAQANMDKAMADMIKNK